MDYILKRGGREFGPYSLGELRRILRIGNAAPTDLVWSDHVGAWIPLADVLSDVATAHRRVLMPPSLSWAEVFVCGRLTLGIFTLFWLFVQASFVRKVDPQNRSAMFLALGPICVLVGLFGGLSARFWHLLLPSTIALILIGVFKMRSSLQRYYNNTEPFGLKLSWVMTLFFNAEYFQYHFHRIAQWKRTRCSP